MGDPFTGAAVGVLFTEVIIALKKAINNVRMFRPRLQQIHSSVTTMESRLKELMGFDKQLQIPNDELKPVHDILEECKRVTLKCLKVKLWKVGSLISMSKMLLAMDERLRRYCNFELQLIIARDGKATLLRIEEIGAIISRKASSSSSVVVDLALGALVGALIAELLPLKQAMETKTSCLGTTESRLESLKPQIEDQMNTFNNSQVEELKPIHSLLRAGLGLINKCRKYQFRDKDLYSMELVDLENRIRRLCQVDLVGILIGDVKINNNTMYVSQLIMDEMSRVSVLLEKDKAVIPVKSIFDRPHTNMPELIDRVSVLLEKDKTCDVPPCPDFVVGQDFSFIYIKEKLLTGEEPVIVIAGERGHGKTTLVTKLGHDEQVKGKYKDIIFVVASEAIGLMAVIQKIINRLRWKISDPDTLNEDDAVQILQQLVAERAKQYHILLVLDDLWYGAESILEKFVNKGIPNFVVLVTSMSELPGRLHQLKGLEHEDAVKLLRHVAIPSDCNHSNLPDDTTIDKVVERCKGSPLALTIVGKSLCGKDRAAWEQKLIQWSDGNDDQLSTILSSLMYSLKGLDGTEELERVKKCFLDLGSFPEDHQICVATLIDMWSELYNMGGSGMDAIAAITELSVRRLVDLVIKREHTSLGDGYYNDIYVMQTDAQMRELTIHLNSEGPIEDRERVNLDIRKNKLPEWTLLKQSLKARLVSIYTDEHFKAAAWPDLELRSAEVLVLIFRATENYTLPEFIKNMVSLKALIVINNGDLPVEVNNFHVIASLPNLKKMRLEHIKIASLSFLDFSLENLEKLSAFLCEISKEIQTSGNPLPFPEVYPKLEEIDISYCPDLTTLPYEICESETLKKISITDCHQLSELPEDIGNLMELQVLRLNMCTNLEMLPDSIGDLDSLNFLDISNCVSIYKLPESLGRLHQLKELNLSWCLELSSLPKSVFRLRQLEYLTVDKERVKFIKFFKNHPKLKMKVAEKERSLSFLRGTE